MSNPKSPEFILAAVNRIYGELPTLIGQDTWTEIVSDIDKNMNAIGSLELPSERLLPAMELFKTLSKYEITRSRLASELKMQEIISGNIGDIFAGLSTHDANLRDQLIAELYMAVNWEIDAEDLPEFREDSQQRSISIKAGGIGGAKSFKFQNFSLDIASMMTTASGFLFTGQSILDKPKPFVIAAGMLVMVGTLLHSMTKDIGEQEATVYWGFIVLMNDTEEELVSESNALWATNNEREKHGIDPLGMSQFKNSLRILESLGSIKRVDKDNWRVVEEFKLDS